MKLFIISANKEVASRWAAFADRLDFSIEFIDSDQLLSQKISESSCGLVHINSITENILDHVCVTYPKVKWVALSDVPSDAEGLRLLEKGFRGYLNTYVTEALFNELLKVVVRNDIWAGPSITQLLLKQYLANALQMNVAQIEQSSNGYGFTDREEEVLDTLVTGASNKEIARELGITERTVKAHVTSLLKKTGTKDRLLLVLKLAHQTV